MFRPTLAIFKRHSSIVKEKGLTNGVIKLCKAIFFYDVEKPLEDGQARPKHVRQYNVLSSYKLVTLDET
jgi:hypothetical protein